MLLSFNKDSLVTKLIRAKCLKSDNFVTDEVPVQLLDDSLTHRNNSCHPDKV